MDEAPVEIGPEDPITKVRPIPHPLVPKTHWRVDLNDASATLEGATIDCLSVSAQTQDLTGRLELSQAERSQVGFNLEIATQRAGEKQIVEAVPSNMLQLPALSNPQRSGESASTASCRAAECGNQVGNDAQQSRFTRAGYTHESDKLAFLDGQVELFEDGCNAIETDRQVFGVDYRCHSSNLLWMRTKM
jgi:hypothetical protein